MVFSSSRRWQILKPLEYTRKLGSFHIRCTAKGGGQAGQAGAIRLGLARALEAHDPWLRKFLKKGRSAGLADAFAPVRKQDIYPSSFYVLLMCTSAIYVPPETHVLQRDC